MCRAEEFGLGHWWLLEEEGLEDTGSWEKVLGSSHVWGGVQEWGHGRSSSRCWARVRLSS